MEYSTTTTSGDSIRYGECKHENSYGFSVIHSKCRDCGAIIED